MHVPATLMDKRKENGTERNGTERKCMCNCIWEIFFYFLKKRHRQAGKVGNYQKISECIITCQFIPYFNN